MIALRRNSFRKADSFGEPADGRYAAERSATAVIGELRGELRAESKVSGPSKNFTKPQNRQPQFGNFRFFLPIFSTTYLLHPPNTLGPAPYSGIRGVFRGKTRQVNVRSRPTAATPRNLLDHAHPRARPARASTPSNTAWLAVTWSSPSTRPRTSRTFAALFSTTSIPRTPWKSASATR